MSARPARCWRPAGKASIMHDIQDTIAAMATAPGESGIGVIRISGSRAFAVADGVFKAASGRAPSAFKSFTVHYGWIVRRFPGGEEVIDEGLLTVMAAPRTYTREDCAEISCHGGMVAMRAVLELVLEKGCRLAEPGEFTRRAFLNGRIDLAQAEAVLDVIKARTDTALKIGLGQLKGELSRGLGEVRQILLACLAPVEAQIDFPEDEQAVDREGMSARLEAAAARIEALLAGSARGRVYREGVRAVICGKPNAGKSSLLNALLREERSIVTPVAGTTRDTVEEVIDIKGIPVRVIDTAGILEPRDLIEKKAMKKTAESIAAADLAIIVFDGSAPLDGRDTLLMRRLAGKRSVAVINKADLRMRIDEGRIRRGFPDTVVLSAKRRSGIGLLEDAVARVAGCADGAGQVVVSNMRHVQQLKKIKKIIEETRKYRDNELPPECAAQNLKDACGLLDRLLGKSYSEDLLEKIFGEFCIGK